MAELCRIDPLSGVWRISAETHGYLIVRGNRALLIDCPDVHASTLLTSAGLPLPEIVLHTQVQEEHCREWASLPETKAYVFSESQDVALRHERFWREARTVWGASRNWDDLGEEKYGVAGCMTERPPGKPLNVAGLLRHGDVFQWQDVTLEVLLMPGSGKRSIGFFWGKARCLFSGDLLRAGGYLANLYDIERSYGGLSGYCDLRRSLASIKKLRPRLLLPSTGPTITDPTQDVARLMDRIEWLDNPPSRRAETPLGLTNYSPYREFGRYRETVPGVAQNNDLGNTIVFVDQEGRGLMIDPGPNDGLSWGKSSQAFHKDLDLLEDKMGLKRIELVLVTHYHGDHVQFCNLVRERYGAQILATPDVSACMERPDEFRYPCSIDWYGFPFTKVSADRRIPYDTPIDWHGTPVMPIHTPGHCYAHAGYVIPWQGLLTVCTGDVMQYGNGPITLGLPILYNDTGWPDRGFLVTFRRLQDLGPGIVLGGHSHSFFDRDGSILRDFCDTAEETLALAQDMVLDRNLIAAMTPPGYDEKRELLNRYASGSRRIDHCLKQVDGGLANAAEDG